MVDAINTPGTTNILNATKRKKILDVSKLFLSDSDGENGNQEIQEIKKQYKTLYKIQKNVLGDMLKHIEKGKDPDMLLDITTGFGKSFIQISFASILKNANTNYRIIVPDNLVLQFQKEVNKFFYGAENDVEESSSNSTAEHIKKQIIGHKEFFITDWQNSTQLPEPTVLMIDEIDLATKEDLYRKRFKHLAKKYPCISLSATPQEWLYKSIKESTGKISISLKRKIEEMGIIKALSISATASSVMKRTNKRSGFAPYACIIAISYMLTALFKIYLNSYVAEKFIAFSLLYDFYNFYINIFIYHPIIGQVSLLLIVLPVLSLINLVVGKIADRDISSRLIANLLDDGASSPAHEDVCKIEETFICKKNPKGITTYSPRGYETLILTSNYDVIRNLSGIYRDGIDKVYKNGKLSNYSYFHDKYELGRKPGGQSVGKFDFSYKEAQRSYCIEQCKTTIRNCLKSDKKVKEKVNEIDFSDTVTYSEYRVMHGIINNTLLALLPKYPDVIALDKARAENLGELCKEVKEIFKDSNIQRNIKEYLEKKGFKDDLLTELTESIECVVNALKTGDLNTIVKNWELDKKLHNMMKIGDEYQVLDDICTKLEEITTESDNLSYFRSGRYKLPTYDVYKDQLERYLEDNFGLKSDEFIKETYKELQYEKGDKVFNWQSKDYPAVAALFRKHNLIEKINENAEKFPLYKLKEICNRNKIIFDNFSHLKIEGPFTGFDENGKPKAYQYASEVVAELFKAGLLGNLVDPSKGTGFQSNVQSISMLIGKNDDKTNNPDDISQGYGRNRGRNEYKRPCFRLIANQGVKLCFDVEKLTADNSTTLLFEARNERNKRLPKTIVREASEEIIQYINDRIDNGEEVNYEHCKTHIIVKKLKDLYNTNDHVLEKTTKEFSHILQKVKKELTSYKKNIKNQGKPSALYAVPYYIARIFSIALYYFWAFPNYLMFCLSTIGEDKITNGVASAEATYVRIIKNYTFMGSIENQKTIDKLLELSKNKPELFDKLINSSVGKKVLKNITSPLQDAHILTILNSIYPENNKDKVKNIRSLLSQVKNKETINTDDRETVNYILEISKEIVAAHAWYHDSSKIIDIKHELALKNYSTDKKVFHIRNVGNSTEFLLSAKDACMTSLRKNFGKTTLLSVMSALIIYLFTNNPIVFIISAVIYLPLAIYIFRHSNVENPEKKVYRESYGNTGAQVFVFLVKWFPLLVVLPQVPYLFISNLPLVSAITTFGCIPLMAFVFGYPERFRSITFNKQIADCNKLEFMANEEKFLPIEKASDAIDEISSILQDIEPLTEYDIIHGSGEHTNPIDKLLAMPKRRSNCIPSTIGSIQPIST